MQPSCLVPKLFLCRYPLSLGASIYGIIMICVNVAGVITISSEMISLSRCDLCTASVLRTTYGFGGTAILYCIIMVFIDIWFLWAIKYEHSSVILIWVVVTSMWLVHAFCLVLVLLCMFIKHTSFVSWVLSAIFGLVAFCIAGYGIAVALGLWFQMKTPVQ